MGYQVALSPSARRDLRDIVRYISLDSPVRAVNLGQLLVSSTKRDLRKTPVCYGGEMKCSFALVRFHPVEDVVEHTNSLQEMWSLVQHDAFCAFAHGRVGDLSA